MKIITMWSQTQYAVELPNSGIHLRKALLPQLRLNRWP
jgi:hypothetical protein